VPGKRGTVGLVVAPFVAAVVWSVLVGRREDRQPVPLVSAVQSEREPAQAEGRYDIRQGAAGYAQIIGTLGALAVPAIFVLFTVPQASSPHKAPLVALAGGLLIIAMLASIGGAIGLSAIGAEQDLTGNLVPATMFLAVAASVSLMTVLGAFEVLAAIYLPESTTLFAVITGVAGLIGVFFTALSIADSWHTGPRDPARRRAWQATQWIRSRQQADSSTLTATGVGAIPAVTGIALRIAGIHISLPSTGVAWLVGSSLVLAIGAIVLAGLRTRHPVDGYAKGLRFWEAYGTTLLISFYALVLMIWLPGAQVA
jgi:hypothetical protein